MKEMMMPIIFWNAKTTLVFNFKDLSAKLFIISPNHFLQQFLQEGIVGVEEEDAAKGYCQ
jgi:hypothetical protein